MSPNQEKRLLLIGIAKLERTAALPATTMIEQIDLLERVRTLNNCLQRLCWSDIDRRTIT